MLDEVLASKLQLLRPSGEPFRIFFPDARAYTDDPKFLSAAKLVHTGLEYAPSATGPYNYRTYYPKIQKHSYPIYFYYNGTVNADGETFPIMRENYDLGDWNELH